MDAFFYLTGEESQRYGGVPPELFEVNGLEELDLSYLGLTAIPDEIHKLVNLNKLNLAYNPLLESISGAVGELPLKSIRDFFTAFYCSSKF